MRNKDVVGIRKQLPEKLGGIEEPLVKNQEWLYLLKECGLLTKTLMLEA